MKIVKFKNGEYAIRKWFFGYKYLALNTGCWYDMEYHSSIVLSRCVARDINKLIKRMNPKPPEPIDYGTPIDTDEESFWNKIKNNKKKLTKLQDKVSIKLTELDEAIEERDE